MCSCTGTVLLGPGCSEHGGEQRGRQGLLGCDGPFLPPRHPPRFWWLPVVSTAEDGQGLNASCPSWVGCSPCPAARAGSAGEVLGACPGWGPGGGGGACPGEGRRCAADGDGRSHRSAPEGAPSQAERLAPRSAARPRQTRRLQAPCAVRWLVGAQPQATRWYAPVFWTLSGTC